MKRSAKAREIGRECLAVRVRLLNRKVTAICDEGLRPFGVRVAQVNILVAAANLGPVAPTKLAALLAMDKSTLSRDAEKLIARGWMATAPGADARGHLLTVTPAGIALIERVHPAWAAAQERLKAELGRTLAAAVADRVDGWWAAEASR
jgi:DNA-binding MarR family transcriptional regulator